MDNLPHKMPRKALFASTICILCFIPVTKGADPNFLYINCPNATLSTTSTYTANSTYHTNLKSVLSNLSSNTNSSIGFYNFTAGSSPGPDAAYGLFICRGDLSADECRDCVTYAVGDVVERCPSSKQVTVWYDPCILRYSNASIFSVVDTSFRLMLINPENATNATSFREALGKVMDDVSNRASRADSGKKKFATGILKYTPLRTLYGLAQCTPDLSQSDCYSCLRTGLSKFPSCCDAKIGARVLFPSCYVHYETYPFFSAGFGAPPPPSRALPHPPNSTGKGGVSSQLVIASVVSISVSILLLVVGFCFVIRRAKQKYNFMKEANGGNDISTVQSLQLSSELTKLNYIELSAPAETVGKAGKASITATTQTDADDATTVTEKDTTCSKLGFS